MDLRERKKGRRIELRWGGQSYPIVIYPDWDRVSVGKDEASPLNCRKKKRGAAKSST